MRTISRLILSVLLLPSILSAYPKAVGRVNDYVHVLSKDEGTTLESQLYAYSIDGPEIAIALVPNLEGQSVQDYAAGLANYWKVGNKQGGVLILIAMDERQIRVVPNDTAQAWLSPREYDDIYTEVLRPAAQAKKWGKGLMDAAHRINEDYSLYIDDAPSAKEQESPPDPSTSPAPVPPMYNQFYAAIIVVFVFVLFLVFAVLRLFHRGMVPKHEFEASQQEAEQTAIHHTTPAQRKRHAEKVAKEKAKHAAQVAENKRRHKEAARARKIAARLRRSAHRQLKRLKRESPKDYRRALVILHHWRKVGKSDRRWAAREIPAMRHYVNYQPTHGGFTVMDFLFWHWVLFPSHSYSSDTGYSGYQHHESYTPSSFESSSSSSWSAPSFSGGSFGGFSGGGGFSSSSGGGGGF